MRTGDFSGAESVYRKELDRNPRSGRALFGLAEALNKQGKTTSAELVRKEFEKAWAESDTKLTVEDLYGKGRSAAMSPRSVVR